ncbi:MAG: hypothetical protein ACO1QB_11070 [Verrucomicrobiales bacterium]
MKVTSVIGAYLCLYVLLLAIEPFTGKGGALIVIALMVVTCIGAFVAVFVALKTYFPQKGWLFCIPVSAIVAVIIAIAVTVGTLWNPLTVRPSPIPLSGNTLNQLNFLMHLILFLCGASLLIRNHLLQKSAKTVDQLPPK